MSRRLTLSFGLAAAGALTMAFQVLGAGCILDARIGGLPGGDHSGGTGGGSGGGGGTGGRSDGSQACDAPNLVLFPSCGNATCHGPPLHIFGDFITDPPSLIGRSAAFPTCQGEALIETTLPVRGVLFDRLRSDACGPGTRMPMQPAAPLTEAQISCLIDWAAGQIRAGSGSGGSGGAGGGPMGCPGAVDIISDFSTGATAIVNQVPPRTGRWDVRYQGDGTNTAEPPNVGRTIPAKLPAGGLPRDTAEGSPCSGPGALRMQARGIEGWGVDMAAYLVPDLGGRRGTYDAGVYRGVRAWVKCATEIRHVNLLVSDGNTDFDTPSPLCLSYADCVPHGSWNNTVGPTWTQLEVDFATAIQNPNQVGVTTIPQIDRRKISSVRLRIDADYVNGDPQLLNFDCMIDDVHFYR
jgi:hypothetical protein